MGGVFGWVRTTGLLSTLQAVGDRRSRNPRLHRRHHSKKGLTLLQLTKDLPRGRSKQALVAIPDARIQTVDLDLASLPQQPEKLKGRDPD